ncbi:DegT/DnrJ/EryC1/StrS family aminotransferase [Devosia sp. Leaf64]|uniref:DegT/DnrJ/EryC1/StrS family aminotransferase n=1 Tax=Devosia sp. Leaf64 TaxID=1736229 RepID=UPI0007132FCD|nr:DegT/DnrJ/EryC1/StrS family aminotransferase [Devosia sp. Leaf64]KQN74640.1 erythromycin biosynthesis sensory transduction protein eryC1 [Devosia sp. Leaf64]
MIPMSDLQAQYKSIRREVEQAVIEVLASGQYVLGREVEAFEEEFAAFCGSKHGIAVNSGTSALHLALLAADIGPGDEVITTPLTFVATASAIVSVGAIPVFVDIDPLTLTLDPVKVEAAITERTRAILPVHLYGQMADMDPLRLLAHRFGLVIVEDACQAHGAEYFGRRAGSIGMAGCFSFYPGKNLGACGEGGFVTTNSDAAAERIRRLRDWGQLERYHHVEKGFNYRMDAIQGAILRIKLRYLEGWTETRRALGQYYGQQLAGVPGIDLPLEAEGRRHVYHVFAIRLPERDALASRLGKAGIQTGLHYPVPVHLQHAYADLGYRRGDFPEAEAAATEVLSLPIYPELSFAKAREVADCVADRARVHA